MLGCSWYPLQEHAQWKEPTVFTQRSWQPPLLPSLHSFRSRCCMEHNYACSYIENKKVLSTVNQLLIMCKKFFRGLWDILWRQHFSPRTSPPMSRILHVNYFHLHRENKLPSTNFSIVNHEIKSSQINVDLQYYGGPSVELLIILLYLHIFESFVKIGAKVLKKMF